MATSMALIFSQRIHEQTTGVIEKKRNKIDKIFVRQFFIKKYPFEDRVFPSCNVIVTSARLFNARLFNARLFNARLVLIQD